MRIHIIITQNCFLSGSPSNSSIDENDNLYRYICREVDAKFCPKQFNAQAYYEGAGYLHGFVMDIIDVKDKEMFLKKIIQQANTKNKYLTESEFVRIIAALQSEWDRKNNIDNSIYTAKKLTTFSTKTAPPSAGIEIRSQNNAPTRRKT